MCLPVLFYDNCVGHLELGESWVDCANREVMEETNILLANTHMVHVTNDPNIGDDPNKHYITIFMTGSMAEVTPPQVICNMEPHKCEGWEWVPWIDLVRRAKEAPDTLFEPMLHLIAGLHDDPEPQFLQP
jgi:8-oxo-dGTP diphosphatase